VRPRRHKVPRRLSAHPREKASNLEWKSTSAHHVLLATIFVKIAFFISFVVFHISKKCASIGEFVYLSLSEQSRVYF
jgi:hypothetical protein